jgi:hypothetical protein
MAPPSFSPPVSMMTSGRLARTSISSRSPKVERAPAKSLTNPVAPTLEAQQSGWPRRSPTIEPIVPCTRRAPAGAVSE